jgi:hypothetical protein
MASESELGDNASSIFEKATWFRRRRMAVFQNVACVSGTKASLFFKSMTLSDQVGMLPTRSSCGYLSLSVNMHIHNVYAEYQQRTTPIIIRQTFTGLISRTCLCLCHFFCLVEIGAVVMNLLVGT